MKNKLLAGFFFILLNVVFWTLYGVDHGLLPAVINAAVANALIFIALLFAYFLSKANR